MSALSLLTDIASIGKDVYSVYSAYEQTKTAKEVQDAQEAEYKRQQAIAEAQAKREARIASATAYAAQGGYQTSMAASNVIGIGTTLKTGIESLESATAYNIESTKAQEIASITKALAGGFLGFSNLAAGIEDFSKTLDTGTKTVSFSDYGPYASDYKMGD